MSMAEHPGRAVEPFDAAISDLPHELGRLAKIEPPPWFVAGVMTRVSQPRLPTFWQWLRRPFPIEIRISPLAMVGLVAALTVAFVYLGATLR